MCFVVIIILKLKMQKVFGIWYLKYQIPFLQKVFGKVFKCPQINMYFVFYLNASFWVFDPTLFSSCAVWLSFDQVHLLVMCTYFQQAVNEGRQVVKTYCEMHKLEVPSDWINERLTCTAVLLYCGQVFEKSQDNLMTILGIFVRWTPTFKTNLR